MPEEIKRISGLPDGLSPAPASAVKPPADKPAFDRILGNLVQEVDQLQKSAASASGKMVAGEIEDIHQVMVAVEEAQISFRLLMEIRNKMVEAYKDVMKMQV